MHASSATFPTDLWQMFAVDLNTLYEMSLEILSEVSTKWGLYQYVQNLNKFDLLQQVNKVTGRLTCFVLVWLHLNRLDLIAWSDFNHEVTFPLLGDRSNLTTRMPLMRRKYSSRMRTASLQMSCVVTTIRYQWFSHKSGWFGAGDSSGKLRLPNLVSWMSCDHCQISADNQCNHRSRWCRIHHPGRLQRRNFIN